MADRNFVVFAGNEQLFGTSTRCLQDDHLYSYFLRRFFVTSLAGLHVYINCTISPLQSQLRPPHPLTVPSSVLSAAVLPGLSL